MNNKKITVLGAGSWGTAIACLLARNGYFVSLWGHRKETVAEIIRHRENRRYLPNILFDQKIEPTNDLKEALENSFIVCMVVPSHGFRKVFTEAIQYIETGSDVISAVKGIENKSLMTMGQVVAEILQQKNLTANIWFSVLSGPSFAKEVANDLPTAITIGNINRNRARRLQRVFSTKRLRVYTSTDVTGIEICAALKNIVAIATGISDGLGCGLNARAAIITRGLAEIRRLGMKMGAKTDTFSGLSGIGDLILTCTGDLSRNRSVGLQLGQGKSLEKIQSEMNMVAEGIRTTESGYHLAKKHNVEMPILEQVYKILYQNKDCATAVNDLLSRELKDE